MEFYGGIKQQARSLNLFRFLLRWPEHYHGIILLVMLMLLIPSLCRADTSEIKESESRPTVLIATINDKEITEDDLSLDSNTTQVLYWIKVGHRLSLPNDQKEFKMFAQQQKVKRLSELLSVGREKLLVERFNITVSEGELNEKWDYYLTKVNVQDVLKSFRSQASLKLKAFHLVKDGGQDKHRVYSELLSSYMSEAAWELDLLNFEAGRAKWIESLAKIDYDTLKRCMLDSFRGEIVWEKIEKAVDAVISAGDSTYKKNVEILSADTKNDKVSEAYEYVERVRSKWWDDYNRTIIGINKQDYISVFNMLAYN